jgi:hypothetical protein
VKKRTVIHENICKERYFRDYAALLRAYARRTKGKARSRLTEAAEYLDSQVATAETLAKSRTLQSVNGEPYPANPSRGNVLHVD